MKHTYETGVTGEQRAAEWLQSNHGMRLLEQRCRTKAGEIDLIMLDGETIVFVEVKTRLRAAPGEGLMAVDRRKQQRITNASVLYLLKKGLKNRAVRYDIIEVRQDGVLYIPNAFQPGGGLFYR
jgi:putative endonuclease